MSSSRELELVHELEAVKRELQRTEANLVVTAGYAANGSLAHSLTHEINNALTPIIGNAQILSMLHAQDPETVERVGQIINNARRIADWIATLRQLTGESSQESTDFSFNGLARDVFEFYAERFQRLGIAKHLDLDAGLPTLRGKPDQIHRVLMLLLQNAMEAVPSGGRISLQTVYSPTDETMLAILTSTGEDIALEQQTQLFGPQSTTKQERQLTPPGWGLFTCKQIVQAHAGSLEIAGPADAGVLGTRVQLRLPLQNQVVT